MKNCCKNEIDFAGFRGVDQTKKQISLQKSIFFLVRFPLLKEKKRNSLQKIFSRFRFPFTKQKYNEIFVAKISILLHPLSSSLSKKFNFVITLNILLLSLSSSQMKNLDSSVLRLRGRFKRFCTQPRGFPKITLGAFFFMAMMLFSAPGAFLFQALSPLTAALSRLAVWVFEIRSERCCKALELVFCSWRLLAALGAFAASRVDLRICSQGVFFTALGLFFDFQCFLVIVNAFEAGRAGPQIYSRVIFFSVLGIVSGSWRFLPILNAFAAGRMVLENIPGSFFYDTFAAARVDLRIFPQGRFFFYVRACFRFLEPTN